MVRFLLSLGCMVVLLWACASREGGTEAQPGSRSGSEGCVYVEEGAASWYGEDFNGKKTASGEVIDANAFTAAHQQLPFNTMVEVTNLANNQTVQVRINDRGPFADGRIVDLSHSAALALGIVNQGTARVRLEACELETPPVADPVMDEEAAPVLSTAPVVEESVVVEKPDLVMVQLGSFQQRANAASFTIRLQQNGFNPDIELFRGFYRVVLLDIPRERLEEVKSSLAAMGVTDVVMREG